MAAKRGENYSKLEKHLIVELAENYSNAIAENYSNAIDSKATDGKTCKEKENCWIEIKNFNSRTTGCKRTHRQNLWRNMNQKTNKDFAKQRQ